MHVPKNGLAAPGAAAAVLQGAGSPAVASLAMQLLQEVFGTGAGRAVDLADPQLLCSCCRWVQGAQPHGLPATTPWQWHAARDKSSGAVERVSTCGAADARPRWHPHVRSCRHAGVGEGEADEVLLAAASPSAKQQLLDNGRRALEVGAFGVPSMLVRCSALAAANAACSRRDGATAVAASAAPQEAPGSAAAERAGEGTRPPALFFGSDRLEQLAWLAGRPWHGPQPHRAQGQQLRARL